MLAAKWYYSEMSLKRVTIRSEQLREEKEKKQPSTLMTINNHYRYCSIEKY